jgi:hypothetical protein
VFDGTPPARARSREVERKREWGEACSGRLIDAQGRVVARCVTEEREIINKSWHKILPLAIPLLSPFPPNISIQKGHCS